MTCPICRGPLLTLGPATMTLAGIVPFCDDEGRLHAHDSNTVTQDVACEDGHSFYWSGSPVCWCGHNVDTWTLEPARHDVALALARTRLLRIIEQFGRTA